MRMTPISLLLALLPLAACGGRVNEDLFAEVDDASFESGGGEGGGADGGGVLVDSGGVVTRDSGGGPIDASVIDTSVIVTDSGGGPVDSGPVVVDVGPPVDAGGLTIKAACDKIANATCSSAFKACCESSGFGWDALGCSDVSHLWCGGGADGVASGKTVFDPSWADACAKGWGIAASLCQPHLFDWVKAQAPCSQMFNGKVAPGGVCSASTDCKVGPGQTAWCDESAKRCRAVSIVSLGQPCNYFGATIRWCDKGLACDTNASGVSTCVTATAVGGACFGPDDTACGMGFSCRAGKCAAGSPPGATCSRDLECASWSCAGGRCTDLRQQLASKALCGTL